MFLLKFLASLISVASLTKYVVADLKITADHHSFGGVNYPSLQYLEPNYRDSVIRAIAKTNARVIRLFSKTSRVYSIFQLLSLLQSDQTRIIRMYERQAAISSFIVLIITSRKQRSVLLTELFSINLMTLLLRFTTSRKVRVLPPLLDPPLNILTRQDQSHYCTARCPCNSRIK
jgi:hypothetical protein